MKTAGFRPSASVVKNSWGSSSRVKRRREMTAEFLAYERPTYYGMLVAFYQPTGCRQSPPAE